MSADDLAQLKWKVEDQATKQAKLLQMQAQPNINPQDLAKQAEQTSEARSLAEHRWGMAFGRLDDRAALEEIGPAARHLFVSDTADTAAAVDTLHTTATDPAQVRTSAEAVAQIEKAYRLLESGHNLLEVNSSLSEMAAQERWELARTEILDQALADWDFWSRRAKEIPNQLRSTALPNEIRSELQKTLGSDEFRAVDQEARNRLSSGSHRKPIAPRMETLARDLTAVADRIQPYMEEARKVIAEYAPSLVDQLRAVSKLAEQVQDETDSLTGRLDDQPAEQTRADAAGVLDEQQQLNDHLDTIRDSLRRDANIQDLAEEAGRQRARDADDAVAMLRRPPPKAEDLLAQAAVTSQPDAQQHALEQAVDQQQKLNDALDLITEHYENLEAGSPEQFGPEHPRPL